MTLRGVSKDGAPATCGLHFRCDEPYVPETTRVELTPLRNIEQVSLEEVDSSFAIVTKGLKPKLRGIPDVIASVFALPAAALLVNYARSGLPTKMAALYASTLVLLFAISAFAESCCLRFRASRTAWASYASLAAPPAFAATRSANVARASATSSRCPSAPYA